MVPLIYKKNSLTSIRAALDRHLRSEPHNKKFSICDGVLFHEANQTLHAYLKHLIGSGKIAGTIHKTSLTPEAVQHLFQKGELASAETWCPRALMQTVWFYISLYFGKRGRENQSVMKKSMLRLCLTTGGDEYLYFELNKDKPGAVLSSKNHTGGLEGTEDHSDGKIFAMANSSRCPVKTIQKYLARLNPEIENLFQRPKDLSAKFNPRDALVWYERKAIGHNTLDNMLRNMSERAGISPYYTNHSLRATTITILSSNNVETRKIKAVTGHRSDTSIESYCERPTLGQFKHMSSTLSSFVHGEEASEPATSSSSIIPALPADVAPSQRPQSVTESRSRVDNNSISLARNEENINIESITCGVSPQSILQSGTFQGCSFTFNITNNK